MNKFVLLLGLLLIFNLSKSDDDQMSTLYDHATYLIEGMSQTGQGLCAAVLRNNKATILPIIESIIADMKAGVELSTVLSTYLTRLVFVDGFVLDCNPFALLGVVNKFNSAQGIEKIGNLISNNAADIFYYVQEFKNKETLDEKLVPLGHILSIVLEYNVN